MSATRIVLLSLIAALAGGGCGGDDMPPIDARASADGSTTDGALADAPIAIDASGECVFNGECPADQRCECDMGLCSCAVGVRGTGGLNAPCTSGNDCASAVCVDFAGDFLCTIECTIGGGECSGTYDTCADVIFVGLVCRN